MPPRPERGRMEKRGPATRHVSYGWAKHLENGGRTDKAWENGQNGWKRVNVTREPRSRALRLKLAKHLEKWWTHGQSVGKRPKRGKGCHRAETPGNGARRAETWENTARTAETGKTDSERPRRGNTPKRHPVTSVTVENRGENGVRTAETM